MTTSTNETPCGCNKQVAEERLNGIRPLVTTDSVSFSYDNLGRLTGLTFLNTTQQTINYDAVGNRTSVVTACSGTGC